MINLIFQGNDIDVLVYQILWWITLVIWVTFLIFAIITLTRYIQRKKKVALYLGLNYLIFVVSMALYQFGFNDILAYGEKTDFYYLIAEISNASVILASIMLYYFFGEIAEISKKRKVTITVTGLILMVWMLLPYDDYDINIEGFQLKYITYTIMIVYCFVVYLPMAIEFFKLSRRVPEQRTSLLFIALANTLFCIYFVVITLYGATQMEMVLVITYLILFAALIGYFIGFIQPSLQKK